MTFLRVGQTVRHYNDPDDIGTLVREDPPYSDDWVVMWKNDGEMMCKGADLRVAEVIDRELVRKAIDHILASNEVAAYVAEHGASVNELRGGLVTP